MPVILLTSCVDDASIEEGYKTGAEAYITKPFDMDLLSIQIQNIMHNHNIVKKALCHHRYPYTQTRKSESHQ